MMRSASRASQAALRARQAELTGADTPASELSTIAAELFAVSGLLVGQPRLRRNLGDPATEPDRRAQLADQLLRGKLTDTALAIAVEAVRLRWSSPWDLADALETSGNELLFAAAEREGRLDEVEDQLFRFQRILGSEGKLATLLDEKSVDATRRLELLHRILEGKVAATTLALLDQAVRSDRTRSVALAVDDLLEAAAARQERSVARVVSAVELSDDQQQRLAAALREIYGRPISLRTALDTKLRGGLVIRVGDELIDGSVASRLAS